MKKIKVFMIIELIIILLASVACLCIIFLSDNKLYNGFQALVYTFFITLPLIHFVLAVIKEAVILSFDFSRKELYFVLVLIVYGVFLLMMLYNLVNKENFLDYYLLFYGSLVLGLIGSPFLAYYLNKRVEDKISIKKNN